MIGLNSLVERISVQLYDDDNDNWTTAELVEWAQEGLGAFADLRPDLFTLTETIDLQPGAEQSVPAGSLEIIRVLGTKVSAGGQIHGVNPFDLSTMLSFRPGWQNDPPGRARQFAMVRDKQTFYLYPPQPDPAHLGIVEHVVVPELPAPAASGFASFQIQLDTRFRRALVDYVLYRTYSKDADVGGQAERASQHFQAFERAAISGSTGIEET